ncbi:ribosome hibernation-promoting factor, HPF/YfiA family [Paucisalibacillus globulus]|uniref:ribosome hibernation-promoting factor, HPF/YfiA family n=1 Tax=Paucisalibacillus globulus TaxID=351095 RepID=UPI000BB6F461|nr:ribosome-associated translation inhibitor RaiA [Paucisalibacillus globulus]
MKFNIRGVNLKVTEAIREYVEKKIGKLEKYFESPITSDVHVNLSVYNDKQRIEVTIPMSGLLLRGEVEHTDLYAAIDLVVDKLERQIRKYKTKVNRKPRQNNVPKFVSTNLAEQLDEEVDDIEIVRTKQFDLKPMDSEEAVLQMDMLGHAFYVFQNAASGDTNVVYRRKDGKYGLIEPK